MNRKPHSQHHPILHSAAMSTTQSILPVLTLLLLLLSHAASAATFLLPIIKDRARLQYYTTFTLGTPPVRLYLSVDLGNPTNWIVGGLAGYTQSSSYKSVTVNSTDCIAYVGADAGYTVNCPQNPSPTCNNLQCNGWAISPLQPDFSFFGLDPVVEDLLAPLFRRDSATSTPAKSSLRLFPFVDTAVTAPLKGLSQYSKGIVSLARNPMALHSQISSAFKTPRKFALCLPSTSSASPSPTGVYGSVYFGGGPYVLPPSTVDLSASFASTPLVSNSHAVLGPYEIANPAFEYYIKINSILIDGAPVKFNSSLLSIDGRGDGGTRLSTMVYYTKLHSEIYAAFVDVFGQKAKALNIAAVGPVSSFKTCFNSTTIKYNARTGSGIPVIELVMAGNARWRIYGSNSMVKVSSDVQCLAIFDAGPKRVSDLTPGVNPAVVIGGKQMEDNLVEFDLEASKIGVTSSLQRLGTSCSQFKGF